jgi:hypothetical protein
MGGQKAREVENSVNSHILIQHVHIGDGDVDVINFNKFHTFLGPYLRGTPKGHVTPIYFLIPPCIGTIINYSCLPLFFKEKWMV